MAFRYPPEIVADAGQHLIRIRRSKIVNLDVLGRSY